MFFSIPPSKCLKLGNKSYVFLTPLNCLLQKNRDSILPHPRPPSLSTGSGYFKTFSWVWQWNVSQQNICHEFESLQELSFRFDRFDMIFTNRLNQMLERSPWLLSYYGDEAQYKRAKYGLDRTGQWQSLLKPLTIAEKSFAKRSHSCKKCSHWGTLSIKVAIKGNHRMIDHLQIVLW